MRRSLAGLRGTLKLFPWNNQSDSENMLQFLREPHGRQHLANLDLLNNRQLLLCLEGKVLLRDSQFLPTLFDDSRIFLDKIRLFDSFWEPLDWCVGMARCDDWAARGQIGDSGQA